MSKKCGRKKKIDKAVDDGKSGAVWVYDHAAPGFFSLAGTAVKASGTDAQPDAAGSVLRGLGSFPNKQKIAFVSRKPCLQKSGF